MKKLILCVFVVVVLCGCEKTPENTIYSDGNVTVYKVKIEGHDYYEKKSWSKTDLEHSPSCKKCYDLFD